MTIARPGAGELLRDNEDGRAEILAAREDLVVVHFRYAPGRNGPPHHVHHHHSDGFFLLQGELQVDLGPDRETRNLHPGDLVVIPPDVVHTFRNASGDDAWFLNLHAPGMGFERYMRGEYPGFDQHEPPADGGRPLEPVPVPEVVAEVAALGAQLLAPNGVDE